MEFRDVVIGCGPIDDEVEAVKEAIEYLIMARDRINTALACTRESEIDDVLMQSRNAIDLIIGAVTSTMNKHYRVKIRVDEFRRKVWLEVQPGP